MNWSRTIVFALLVLATVAFSQEPKEKKRGVGDPQNSFEPRSGPGAGQKFLEKFVGDWDVEKRLYLRGGEPVRMKGTCRQDLIHEGRFLRSEFSFERDGRKSTGTGLIGFETAGDKFTSFWTDSRSTRMSVRQSEQPFSGNEIVLFSKSIGEEPNNARRSKTITKVEDDGKRIVHRQYVPGQDGKERLMMELVMTRKTAAK